MDNKSLQVTNGLWTDSDQQKKKEKCYETTCAINAFYKEKAVVAIVYATG